MDDSLKTESVNRPAAFLGGITQAVRNLAVEQYGSAEGRTLDVACGNGLFFAALPATASRLFGSDLDRGLLVESRSVFRDNGLTGVRLSQADAAHLPYQDGVFDNIFFLNTLINISDDLIVTYILRELMRVCRPGGRVFVDFRNGRNPVLKLRYWLHNFLADFTTRGYDFRQIAGAFETSGFTPVQIHVALRRFPIGSLAYLVEAHKPGPH